LWLILQAERLLKDGVDTPADISIIQDEE